MTIESFNYKIKNLPAETRQLIEIQDIQSNFDRMVKHLNEISQRIGVIEDHLMSIGTRLEQMSNTQQMMLTSNADIALKLTDEKDEIRKLAEQVVKVKQAMGVIG